MGRYESSYFLVGWEEVRDAFYGVKGEMSIATTIST
jgi:hypothetical protein